MSKIGDVIITLEDYGYDYNRLGNKSFAQYDMVCRGSEAHRRYSNSDIRQRAVEADVIYCRWVSGSQYNLLRSASLKDLLAG